MVAAVLHLQEGAGAVAIAVDEVARRLTHRHDVVDEHDAIRAPAERGPGLGPQLFVIADHGIDFRHRGEGLRIDLRRAAGDDDGGARIFAPRPADLLARLANGLVGDCTGVDDDRAIETCSVGKTAHRLAFGEVEAAAKGDDARGHGAGF